jgi:hypothetical protein
MSTQHEELRKLIHGHFGRGLPAADETRMRAHLVVCAECRQVYVDHQMAHRLDPTAPSARERLARALGLPGGARSRGRRPVLWAAASLAVAGAVALTVMARPQGDDGWASRGGSVETPEEVALAVFRIDRHGGSTRATSSISADDELAFAYRNEVGKAFLMVFAVDGHGDVLWYHPAWTRASDNPGALPISKQLGFKELPEAVRHRLQGPTLTVYALFMDTPLDVRAVESRVVRGDFLPRPEAGELLRTLVLEVRP